MQLDPAHQVTALLGQVMVIKNRYGAEQASSHRDRRVVCMCHRKERGLGHIVRGMLSGGDFSDTLEWILLGLNILIL